MIILGIDPGTATTGYGVIKKTKSHLDCLGYGTIKTSPRSETGERLRKINNELDSLIKKHTPDILAVENVYFFKNLKTVIPVSQAKGVILLTAAKKRVPVFEFTPLQVKKDLTQYGWAEKKRVQEKVKSILKLKISKFQDDTADALAVAICCARSGKLDRK